VRSSWCRVLVAVGILCVPAALSAGEGGRIELGVVPFAFSVHSSDGETQETLAMPAGGYVSMARGVYLQWLVTDKIAIEPQASIAALFADGDNIRSILLGLRGNYLFAGADRPSPYLFAGTGLWHVGYSSEGDDSETDPLLGLGVGYRQTIRSAGSVRVEIGYEHVFAGDSRDDANVFSLAVGLGLRF
jgi:hypothetical protein